MADEVKKRFFLVKFINIERKGEGHSWFSNGERFDVRYNEQKVLPEHAINALKDAVKIEWKVNNLNITEGQVPEKYEEPRFHVEVIREIGDGEPPKAESPKEEAKAEIIKEVSKKQSGKKKQEKMPDLKTADEVGL